jgi:hypothetical protein
MSPNGRTQSRKTNDAVVGEFYKLIRKEMKRTLYSKQGTVNTSEEIALLLSDIASGLKPELGKLEVAGSVRTPAGGMTFQAVGLWQVKPRTNKGSVQPPMYERYDGTLELAVADGTFDILKIGLTCDQNGNGKKISGHVVGKDTSDISVSPSLFDEPSLPPSDYQSDQSFQQSLYTSSNTHYQEPYQWSYPQSYQQSHTQSTAMWIEEEPREKFTESRMTNSNFEPSRSSQQQPATLPTVESAGPSIVQDENGDFDVDKFLAGCPDDDLETILSGISNTCTD